MNYSTPTRRAIDELLNEIQMDFPEAPHQFIENVARQSCIRFCELSLYWQEYLGAVYVVRDLFEYDVPVPPYAKLIEIERVFLDEDGEERNFEKSPIDTLSRYRFWNPLNNILMLYPNDVLAEKSVGVIAALKPDREAENFTVPDALLDDHYDALVAGARSRLYRIPRQPWSDPGHYQENQAIFEEAARKARRNMRRGYQSAPDRINATPRTYY